MAGTMKQTGKRNTFSACSTFPRFRGSLSTVRDQEPTVVDRPGDAGGEISSEDLEVLPCIPGFTFECLIGSGGMGRVYKARDETLGRWVAVKLLRSDDPETLARFSREARAQAGIQHDHVCPVYEVGEADGRPYIVMAFVDGVTLLDAVDEMGLETTVSVVADVADALHAAHRTGLIHRDIKPSNVMVEYSEDRGWHGWVMDFGIAQEISGEDLTVTGATLGTPAFMSPEQVQGGSGGCDRRTDVYGLGATLYSALVGRPPYDGSGVVDILVKVASVEPQAPRTIKSSLPKDLETIILKCLEKEPGRRYDNASMLADDLRRWIEGEPIQARRAEWTYRLFKTITRNRLAAAVIGGSMVAIALIGAYALHSVWHVREESRIAQAFSVEVNEMEAKLEKAFLLPQHDIRAALSEVQNRLRRLEDEMEAKGRPAKGPGNHALGRGLNVLRQNEKALVHLQMAWDDGYRNPDVAYALGVALGRLYERELERAQKMTNEAARSKHRTEIKKKFRDPALEYLEMASGLDQGRQAYAEGLIALYEERFDDAVSLAEQAVASDPTFYQAHLLEADIDIARGIDLFGSGEVEAADSAYSRAGEALEVAAEIGRSDPAVHRSRCRLLTMSLESRIRRGIAGDADFDAATQACEVGLRINPDDVGALAAVSQVKWRWGTQLISVGEDPVPLLEESVALAQKAVGIEPDNGVALNDLGVALSKLGLNDLKTGQDPTSHLEGAIEAFDRATEVEVSGHQAFNNRGLARWRLAQWAVGAGEDPLPLFSEAADDFRASLSILENDPAALVNLGAVLLTAGIYQSYQGLDPTTSIDESITVLKKTLEVNPRMAIALNSLGAAFCTRAEWEQDRGDDPRGSLDEAIKAFERSAEENPGSTLVFSNLGSAAATRAHYELDIGDDPTASFNEARAWLDKAIGINPRNSTALFNRASIQRLKALYQLEHGQDPSRAINNADADLKLARDFNPAYSDIDVERAKVENLKARHQVALGRSPAGALKRAQRILDGVIAESPFVAEAHVERARIHLLRANWSIFGAEGLDAEIDGGLNAIVAALKINPQMSGAFKVRGSLLLRRAHELGPGSDRDQVADAAIEAFEKANAHNPVLRRTIAEELEEAKGMKRAEG